MPPAKAERSDPGTLPNGGHFVQHHHTGDAQRVTRYRWEYWLRVHLADFKPPDGVDIATAYAVAMMASTYAPDIDVASARIEKQLRLGRRKVGAILAWLHDIGVLRVTTDHGRGTATRRQLSIPEFDDVACNTINPNDGVSSGTINVDDGVVCNTNPTAPPVDGVACNTNPSTNDGVENGFDGVDMRTPDLPHSSEGGRNEEEAAARPAKPTAANHNERPAHSPEAWQLVRTLPWPAGSIPSARNAADLAAAVDVAIRDCNLTLAEVDTHLRGRLPRATKNPARYLLGALDPDQLPAPSLAVVTPAAAQTTADPQAADDQPPPASPETREAAKQAVLRSLRAARSPRVRAQVDRRLREDDAVHTGQETAS